MQTSCRCTGAWLFGSRVPAPGARPGRREDSLALSSSTSRSFNSMELLTVMMLVLNMNEGRVRNVGHFKRTLKCFLARLLFEGSICQADVIDCC
jgi:hypothetical protein